jgi:hypothetical protein
MNLIVGLRSALIILTRVAVAQETANGQSLPNLFPFPNATGFVETYNTSGKPIDLSGRSFNLLARMAQLRVVPSPCAGLEHIGG